jgi:hypothetical protein
VKGDRLLTRVRLTEIDAINAENSETLGAGLLAVVARAVNFVCLASLDEPKLGRKENVVALAGTLEPLANQFLVITIEAVPKLAPCLRRVKYSLRSGPTQSCPSALRLAQRRDQGGRIAPRR